MSEEDNVLTKEVAEQFIKNNGSVSLYYFSQIDEAAAESLAKHEGVLNLDGLIELSDAAAESLAKHKGFFVFLA